MSNKEQFEKHVEELEQHFPGVPSIGCIGGSYGGQTVAVDNGVAVIAMEGNLNVVTNVLEEASTMPVKYIGRLESDISKLECYRQVNDSDVLTLLESQDISQVVENTINQIKKDFTHISGVFSINCVFRYLLFTQEHYFDTYLKSMSVLGDHAGLIGYGEHYNQQFVNQTMTCVVFE